MVWVIGPRPSAPDTATGGVAARIRLGYRRGRWLVTTHAQPVTADPRNTAPSGICE